MGTRLKAEYFKGGTLTFLGLNRYFATDIFTTEILSSVPNAEISRIFIYTVFIYALRKSVRFMHVHFVKTV